MKQTLALLIFALILSPGFSQSSFPEFADAPLWSVLESSFGGAYTVDQGYEGTLTACGENWSWFTFSSSGDTAFVRSDADRVYFRKSSNCGGKEYLLYDFSAQAGDTVYIMNDVFQTTYDTVIALVDSIGTEVHFGQSRRVVHVRYQRCYQGGSNYFLRATKWVEGIGSTEHPFSQVYCFCDLCELEYELLCLNLNSGQDYQNPNYSTCDTSYTFLGVEKDLLAEWLEVGPNPFGQELNLRNVSAKELNIEILDMQGRTWLVSNLHPGESLTWHSREQTPGIYFLREQTSGGVIKLLGY